MYVPIISKAKAISKKPNSTTLTTRENESKKSSNSDASSNQIVNVNDPKISSNLGGDTTSIRTDEQKPDDDLSFDMIDNDTTLDDQSKVVLKIETLLGYLTSFYNTPSALESLNDDNVSTSSSTLNNNDFLMINNEQTVANRNSADLQNQKSASSSVSSSTKIIQSQFQHTYLEMLAMYEREKTLRIDRKSVV